MAVPARLERVQAELGTVRDKAKQETEEALSLKVREKEEQIASMQRFCRSSSRYNYRFGLAIPRHSP
jgi:hypothetical protein